MEAFREHRFIKRADGRIEYVCEHGVGHTVAVPGDKEDESAWWIHGCDGSVCCEKGAREWAKHLARIKKKGVDFDY